MQIETRGQAIEAVLATIDAHPDGINPRMGKGACRYTATSDPDWHCLIGQMAADRGWKVPGPEYVGGPASVADLFDWPVADAAAEAMEEAQRLADLAQLDEKRWSDIRDDIAALAEAVAA